MILNSFKINNTALPISTYPKVLGFTVDPKLTYSTHIHNISVQAHKPPQMIKALTAAGWGKLKDTLTATYKVIMRSALEYASYIWSPLAFSTSINKKQIHADCSIENCHTNMQHLHDETLPYTSTYSSTPHNTKRKHNIHHICYTNIQHASTLQG